MKITEKGFTMLEVVLTLTLASLMTVYAVVKMNQTGDLEGAARKVAADLRYVRGLALSKGINHGIVFQSTSPYYYMYQKGNPNITINDPLTQQTSSEKLEKYRGVSITVNRTFEFSPTGTPSISGGLTVDLTNGSQTKQVQVVANTGFIEIL